MIAEHNRSFSLCRRLLDPDDLGYAVTQEVREAAQIAVYGHSAPKPTKVYLAGPMSGLPEYNYPAFFHAAELLRERGLIVENPAEHAQRNPQPSWNGYMRQALKLMLDCEQLFLLPGWGRSVGAVIEHDLANELEMPIHYPEDWHAQYSNWALI